MNCGVVRYRGTAAVQARQRDLEDVFGYLKQLVCLHGLISSQDFLESGSVCLNQTQAIKDIGKFRISADGKARCHIIQMEAGVRLPTDTISMRSR